MVRGSQVIVGVAKMVNIESTAAKSPDFSRRLPLS